MIIQELKSKSKQFKNIERHGIKLGIRIKKNIFRKLFNLVAETTSLYPTTFPDNIIAVDQKSVVLSLNDDVGSLFNHICGQVTYSSFHNSQYHLRLFLAFSAFLSKP